MRFFLEGLRQLAFVLTPFFNTILFMSATAAVVSCLILLLRRFLFQKLPPARKYALWSVVILSFVFPFRFQMKNAVLPRMSEWKEMRFQADYQQSELKAFLSKRERSTKSDSNQIKKESSSRESFQGKDFEEVKERKEGRFLTKEILFGLVLPLVWFFGMLTIFFILIIGWIHLAFLIKKRGSVIEGREEVITRAADTLKIRKKITLIRYNKVKTPALVGFLNPKILLPTYTEGLSEENLYYVILHELSHFKRKDMWVNLFLLALQSVYWFHPFSWIIFKLVREDMEMMTDDYVLAHLSKEYHKGYANSLVEVLSYIPETSFVPEMLYMVDGKKNVERRIKMMCLSERMKKYKLWIGLGVLCLISFFVFLFFTEKKKEKNEVLSKINALKEEEITDFEVLHYDEKSKETLYRDLRGEERKEALNALQSLKGKEESSFRGATVTADAFYIRTARGEVHSLIHSRETSDKHLVIDGKSFVVNPDFANTFLKLSRLANEKVPENFPYEEKRYRGMEVHLSKDAKGIVSFSIHPGEYRKPKNLTDKKRSSFESIKEEFFKIYEKNTELFFFLKNKLKSKGFFEEDIRAFAGGRYEEGKALHRISELLSEFLSQNVTEAVQLKLEIYGERIGVLLETNEEYLLYENIYDERTADALKEEKKENSFNKKEDESHKIPSDQQAAEKGEESKKAVKHMETMKALFDRAFLEIKEDEDRELTAEELEKISFAFSPLIAKSEEEDSPIVNTLCNFFYACYGDVKNIDLYSFLWYFGIGENLKVGTPGDEKEFAALKETAPEEVTGEKLEENITPVQRIYKKDVEEVLKSFAGIEIEDLKFSESGVYLKDYDSYYIFTSDFGLEAFTPATGRVKKKELILEDETKRLTMNSVDGRWVFASFDSKLLNYDRYVYRFEDSNLESELVLNLRTGEFSFFLHPAISYLPKGRFEVRYERELLLFTEGGHFFEFEIEGEDTLIYKASHIKGEDADSKILKPGMKFKAVK